MWGYFFSVDFREGERETSKCRDTVIAFHMCQWGRGSVLPPGSALDWSSNHWECQPGLHISYFKMLLFSGSGLGILKIVKSANIKQLHWILYIMKNIGRIKLGKRATCYIKMFMRKTLLFELLKSSYSITTREMIRVTFFSY